MSEAGVGARVAERLYYDSAELKFLARVADIQLVSSEKADGGGKEQVWRVALDRTAFYPESGGQPWDTGVLVATARSGAVLEVPVERVEEDEATGEVWHFVRKPLVEGTEVEGRVDAARRMDHMQQHSGQHLLSAVFLERIGARTVSFHLSPLRTGAETSTIDLALAEGASGIAAEELAGVEDEVNRLVFADRRLCPRWHTREEAEAMLAAGKLRKLPERPGPMRVMEMDGVELNACGGTHVGSTGAIGGLMLRRLEKVKQGWRVEFVCGLRAVRAARREFGVLSQVAGALSVGAADVPGRVAALQEETKAAAKDRRGLLEELAEAKAAELLGAGGDEAGVVRAVFAGKPVEFVKRVASAVARAGRVAVVGGTEGESGSVGVALPKEDTRHAGALFRETAGQMGVRGGGSAEMAQGVCAARQIDVLIERLALTFGEASNASR